MPRASVCGLENGRLVVFDVSGEMLRVCLVVIKDLT